MNMRDAARDTMDLARQVLPPNPDKKKTPEGFDLEHLEKMLATMLTDDGMSKAKMGRWLGRMQAAVVIGAHMNGHHGYITLDTMKEINKKYKKGA